MVDEDKSELEEALFSEDSETAGLEEDLQAKVDANQADAEPVKDDEKPVEQAQEPEAPAEPAAEEAPDLVTKPDEGEKHTVPLAELMEVRKARQEADQRVAQLQGQLQAMQNQMSGLQTALATNQQRPEDTQQIDPLEDPAGFAASIKQELQQTTSQQIQSLSESYARRHYGSEAVDAALQAVASQPQLAAQMVNTPDPYGALVDWHKNQTVLQETGGDLTGYREKIAAEIREQERAKILAELGASGVNPTGKAAPPPSITGATPANGNADPVISDLQAFNEVFSR